MEKYVSYAKEFFYYLHKHPELSKVEYNTTKYIINILNDLACFELDTSYDTGVVATLNNNASLTLAFRADIDALPIQEDSGLEYASINEGVMHACGHDLHTANLLGFACWLKDQKLDLNIKLLFQPNEETTPGSSTIFIENNVLDDVDYVFGLHVDGSYSVGSIGIKPKELHASIDDFDVRILGKGGHISTSHLALDPLYCTSSIVSNMANAVSKRIDPMNPPLIGISSFVYGSDTYNIINDEAFFCGTLRTHNENSRKQAIEFMNHYIETSAASYGLKSDVKWTFGESSLYNDPKLSELFLMHLESKNRAVFEIQDAIYGGEDFSNYSRIKPSLFFILGAHYNEYDLHNAHFIANPEALSYGITLFKDIVEYYNK